MAKQPSITTISTDVSGLDTPLNTNFTNIQSQFDNTLSLDGSTPNAMNADLDMNSNSILNANIINVESLILDGVELTPGSVNNTVQVKKDGTTVSTDVAVLDFLGSNISVEETGSGTVSVNVSGGSGGSSGGTQGATTYTSTVTFITGSSGTPSIEFPEGHYVTGGDGINTLWQWYEADDTLAAEIEPAGTTVNGAKTVITAEKGDARYLELSGGTLTGPVISADGNATAPSVAIGSSNKGFYTTEVGNIRVAIEGAIAANFEAAGTSASLQNTVMTRQKGDARYLRDGVFILQDKKASGTSGGNAVSGWQTRTLNTTIANTISGASRTGNVVTLPAGTYEIRWAAPGGTGGGTLHATRIRDVTNNTTLASGSSCFIGGDGSDAITLSVGFGRFELGADTDIELQHWFNGNETGGLGVSTSNGETEVYSQVEIRLVTTVASPASVSATAAFGPARIVTDDTTAYTLVLDDSTNTIVRMTSTSANVVTIPTNASVAFDIGSVVSVRQSGAGATSITADTGVTLNGVSAGSCTLDEQHAGASLVKVGTDAWEINGAHGVVI